MDGMLDAKFYDMISQQANYQAEMYSMNMFTMEITDNRMEQKNLEDYYAHLLEDESKLDKMERKMKRELKGKK